MQHTWSHFLLLVCLFLLAPSTATADIVVPGYVPAQHDVTFFGVDQYPEYAFLLVGAWDSARHTTSDPVRVQDGVSTDLGRFNKMVSRLELCALPRSLVPSGAGAKEIRRLLDDPPTPVLYASERLVPIHSVEEGSAPVVFHDRYRVVIEDAKLSLTRLEGQSAVDTRLANRPWTILLGAAISMLSAAAIAAWIAVKRLRPTGMRVA